MLYFGRDTARAVKAPKPKKVKKSFFFGEFFVTFFYFSPSKYEQNPLPKWRYYSSWSRASNQIHMNSIRLKSDVTFSHEPSTTTTKWNVLLRAHYLEKAVLLDIALYRVWKRKSRATESPAQWCQRFLLGRNTSVPSKSYHDQWCSLLLTSVD